MHWIRAALSVLDAVTISRNRFILAIEVTSPIPHTTPGTATLRCQLCLTAPQERQISSRFDPRYTKQRQQEGQQERDQKGAGASLVLHCGGHVYADAPHVLVHDSVHWEADGYLDIRPICMARSSIPAETQETQETQQPIAAMCRPLTDDPRQSFLLVAGTHLQHHILSSRSPRRSTISRVGTHCDPADPQVGHYNDPSRCNGLLRETSNAVLVLPRAARIVEPL
ncbi:hypothetical protein BU26DRAFT_338387 [Trematosphaeria pertusa]|uniref:Uncharacterized protein n=1 Tax=Trematosphaeria pertusa TaxID=390896 RepID=A0A6A6IDW0_9PLEO|nr:uncharacterized protein BU26DRAFT_338387 [Trematosphaeria pertusa]KAF2248581.1 hypothetical protein BU26DRAFT_338387 [Trematosphaeria pertusa]